MLAIYSNKSYNTYYRQEIVICKVIHLKSNFFIFPKKV